MSHLHIPDGILPWTVWVPAWALTVVLLVVLGFRSTTTPREVAYRGALGALVLASMSLALPIGPIEYHLSLLGPVGVLLGASSAFEALFVVSAILALVGHGGLTVVGLNALVLGAGSAVARPVFRALLARLGPARAFAGAAAVSQAVAGGLWSAVMVLVVRAHSSAAVWGEAGRNAPLVIGIVVVVFVVGLSIETLVALGLGGFLARVKPELLPRRSGAAPARAAAAGGVS